MFPSSDEHERSVVSVETQGDDLVIRIDRDRIETPSDLLVRCRHVADAFVLSDEVRPCKEPDKEVLFKTPEGGLFSVVVEIWGRNLDVEPYRIWFAQGISYIREVRLNMAIAGGSTDFRSPSVQQWAANRRLAKRANAIQHVQKLSFDRTISSGVPDPAFLVAARQASQLSGETFPTASGARFYPQDSKGDKEPRLALAEWFREQLGKTDAKHVIVFDPYFDEFGAEVLARVGRAGIRYSVVVCTARRPDPTTAIAKLASVFDQLAPMYEGVRIEVLDVLDRERAHDRYVLALYEDGRAAGRHLAKQGPRIGHVAPVERRDRFRDEATYTLTLRVRSRPPRSVRHRRKSAILRGLSVGVRRRPGVSGRRPHLQVPSTPQIFGSDLTAPLRLRPGGSPRPVGAARPRRF